MNGATDTDPGDNGTSRAERRWTVTSLALAHKRIAAASIIVVLGLVAATLLTTLGNPGRQQLSDAASCSQWAAGTPGQKIAYSHLYINEYGRFPNTAHYARAVETAIDKACTKASYLGEADDLSVLASLHHAF